MHTILRTGPVIASALDDQAIGAFNGSSRRGTTNGCARHPRGPRHRPPKFTRDTSSRPGTSSRSRSYVPRSRSARGLPGHVRDDAAVVADLRRDVEWTADGREPPSSLPPRGTGGNRLRSTAVAPHSSGRARLATTSRVRPGDRRRGRPARAARGRGALGGHRGASTSHVVQGAGGLVAGPGEDGFVDTPRHGRAPSASVRYRPSNRVPRPSSVKLSPTISSPSTIQSRP